MKKIRKIILIGICMMIFGGLAACGKAEQPELPEVTAMTTPTPEVAATSTPTPTATPEPTATQPPEVPAKSWEAEEDFYIADSYTVPDSVKNSKYDMEKALTCISLKEAFAPYFKFGMAMSGYNAATFAVESQEMQELLKYHCNTTTATNVMKPSNMLVKRKCQQNVQNGSEDPVIDFTTIDKMLAFCQEAGIGVRGHTLVWHAQTPDWFFREGYSDDGAYVNAETLKYRMESYIRQMIEHCQDNYPGVVYCWDVVNECVDVGDAEEESGWRCRTSGNSPEGTNQWYDILGYEYVELGFTYARKYADEGVSLVYNDYNTWDSKKMFYVCKLIEYLKEKGLVDALGLQSNLSVDTKLFDVYNSLVKYAELGLELQITELSIVAEDTSPESYEIQAEAYGKFMKYIMALDDSNGGIANITVVNVFSLMDGYLLYDTDNNNYCLFDCNIEPKPCYYEIIKAGAKYGKNKPDVLK